MRRISSLVVNNTCEVRGKIIFLLYFRNPPECDEEECEYAMVISQVFGGEIIYMNNLCEEPQKREFRTSAIIYLLNVNG